VVHDGRADGHGTGSLANLNLFKGAVRLLFEDMFASVIGNIDERGLELHQGIQMVVNRIDGLSFERGKDLKRYEGVFRLIDVVYDFHPLINVLESKSK
jgi:hypothetical protein